VYSAPSLPTSPNQAKFYVFITPPSQGHLSVYLR